MIRSGPKSCQIDLDLVGQPDVIRHVDFDGAVAERLHHFVALQFLIFRLIGMPENHFIDIGLGKLLGLDEMFLARAPTDRKETPRPVSAPR